MIQLITFADCLEQKWKNGHGYTREIIRYPKDQEKFEWRISAASLSVDSNFSFFPGYERMISIISKVKIRLHNRTKGIQKNLHYSEIYSFSGNDEIFINVEGSGLDLGIIFRADLFKVKFHSYDFLHKPRSFQVKDKLVLFFALDEFLAYSYPGEIKYNLNVHDSLFVRNDVGMDESIIQFLPAAKDAKLLAIEIIKS